jgi:hypothetical protein
VLYVDGSLQIHGGLGIIDGKIRHGSFPSGIIADNYVSPTARLRVQ